MFKKSQEKKKPVCESCTASTCTAAERREGESDREFEERLRLQSHLCRIGKKIIVLSGKGGVGKSTMAVHLAAALAQSGKRTGLLDVDIHGPSVPTMLGIENPFMGNSGDELHPFDLEGLKVMSLGFFLRNQDEAVIWRGPMKMNMIKQFLMNVAWGDLDFLIIDSPPGTGDEPLSVCQLIGGLDGAVVVTTPQMVAAIDVRKSITFCRQLKVPVLGVVENMSGFTCPKCGEITPILRSGGGQRISEDMGVPFLGSIPMDPTIADACDNGKAFAHQNTLQPIAEVVQRIIIRMTQTNHTHNQKNAMNGTKKEETKRMRIAIPLAEGKLTMHFGHCSHFALLDVDPSQKKILKREDIEAPPHQPGLLPVWLSEKGANMIIAGGMGQRAQSLFLEKGIQVLIGAPSETPETLVNAHLSGTLRTGENVCDH